MENNIFDKRAVIGQLNYYNDNTDKVKRSHAEKEAFWEEKLKKKK